MEAWVGIEPTNNGFADRRLTTWLPGRLFNFLINKNDFLLTKFNRKGHINQALP